MTPNDSPPEIDPTPGLDQAATTIQIQRWTLTDVKELLGMFVAIGSARILPPDLVGLVEKALPKNSDPWPRWLVLGIAVRLGLRAAKEALRAYGQLDGSVGRTLLLKYAARLLRDNIRTAFVLSSQATDAFRANVIHLGLDEELRELKLVYAEDYSEARVREAGISVVIFDTYVAVAGHPSVLKKAAKPKP